ncbi:MAG: glycoside hydrolase family 3 N-terminal domain-containing protein, partial [Candidatus Hydrogenedentes bacterium]|nr:glycoside hydrolase family 3 N-terminal domain-containing protein [Candidatus Hydrogenedentota bacterium]
PQEGPAEPAGELASMEDVWPARHLFIAVSGQKLDSRTKEMLAELKPGGVLLRPENIRVKNQMIDLVSEMKAAVGLGTTIDALPLIAVSQEGGASNPLRLKEAPTASKIGAAKDLALAREAGVSLGKSAFDRGVGVVFAPVLDVYVPGGAKEMQARSFGEVPEEVAAIGLSYADGLLSTGVLPVVKHFPGMGSTKEDPSKALPVAKEDQDVLSRLLLPFSDAASHNVPGILVGHVAVPAIDNESDPPPPASLSVKFLRGLLREKWGYPGVVLADDISVAAITKTKTIEAAAVEALANGCDALLILDPSVDTVRKVCDAIEKAAADGVIDRAKLSESKKRLDGWQQSLKTPRAGLDGPLPQLPQTPPAVTETVTATDTPAATTDTEYIVVGGDGLKKIATKFGVTIDEIKEWNGLTSDSLQVGQKLIIKSKDETTAPAPVPIEPPAPTAAETPAAEEVVEADTATTDPPGEEPSVEPPANTKAIQHVVKTGDFLSSIATAYGVTYQDLMRWNHLNDTKLNAGQSLTVYVAEDFAPPAGAAEDQAPGVPETNPDTSGQPDASAVTSNTTTPSADTEVTYTVKKGDNLANIAAKYGVTAQDIREWNGIEGNRINIDQKLKIRPKKLPAE